MARHGAPLLRLLSSSPSASLYLPRRSMSRLFVGGLSFTTEEEGLRTAFTKFGEVLDAKIVKDRETGRSRGFGFVTFMTDGDAETAMNKMTGQFLDGRVIRVDRASPRPAPPPRLSNPVVESPVEPVAEDWGTIPSPMAAVPQNVGLADGAAPAASDSPSAPVATALPDLSSLASSSTVASDAAAAASTAPASPAPFSFNASPPSFDFSAPTKASTKDTGPSFNFIDLNLSDLPRPDPNQVPRRRPPRLRSSSMADCEFGYYMSEHSKFPFNTKFESGIPRSSGPEFDFDFEDIKKANDIKQAEWKAAKEAKMAEEAAKKAEEEAAQKAAEEAAKLAKEAEEAAKQAAEEATNKQDTDADVLAKEETDTGDKQQRSDNVESHQTTAKASDNVGKEDESRPKETAETFAADDTRQSAITLESAQGTSAEASHEIAQETHSPSTDARQAAYGS